MFHLLERLALLSDEKRFCVFDRERLQTIHRASLEILQDVGCRIEHERVRDMLQEAGHDVCHESRTVKFAPNSIEDAIERHRKPTAPLTIPSRFGAEIGGIATQIYDPAVDRVRPATKADLDRACIIGDSVDAVTKVGQLFMPQDVPQVTCTVHSVQTMVTRSLKSRDFELLNLESLQPIRDILCVAAGNWEKAVERYQPSYLCFITTPLTFTRQPLEVAFEAMRLGFAVRFALPMVIAGATAPVTIPGALALSNAETLVGLVIADLLNQPWLYEGSPVVLDPQTGGSNYSGPDRVILDLATTDLCRFYGIPLHTHIKHSDPVAPDFQSGFERAYGLFLQLLTGMKPGLVCGLTGPSGAAGCLEQILLDVECLGVMEKLTYPIEVNEKTLCLDLIKRVGIGGNYLSEDHTVENFRRVLWLPELMKRYSTSSYNQVPQNALRNAMDRVAELLRKNDPHPLTSECEREISMIVSAADRQFAGMG